MIKLLSKILPIDFEKNGFRNNIDKYDRLENLRELRYDTSTSFSSLKPKEDWLRDTKENIGV